MWFKELTFSKIMYKKYFMMLDLITFCLFFLSFSFISSVDANSEHEEVKEEKYSPFVSTCALFFDPTKRLTSEFRQFWS